MPWTQLKIKNRVVVDIEEFISRMEGATLSGNLQDGDVMPKAHDSQLLDLCGWKINVLSMIDSKATPNVVIQGWHSLEKLISINTLIPPLLYLDYLDVGYGSWIEPRWINLLRFCYWYQKCVEMKNQGFYHKVAEIKRALRKPILNVKKTLNANSRGLIPTITELHRIVSSYSSELMFAAYSKEINHRVSFHHRHDFIIDLVPVEVKSTYSRFMIKHNQGIPKLVIRGQVLGRDVNISRAISKFVNSKKVLADIKTAIDQGGQIVFLDATYTFAGILLNSFSAMKKVKLPLSEAIAKAIKVVSGSDKLYFPVIVSASVIGYEHQLSAFTVLAPFKKL